MQPTHDWSLCSILPSCCSCMFLLCIELPSWLGVDITFGILQVLGELHLALESANQRVLFGRIPSCDVHLEVMSIRAATGSGASVEAPEVRSKLICGRVLQHLSVSRHHATLTLDPSGHLFLTDLGAGDPSDSSGLCACILVS